MANKRVLFFDSGMGGLSVMAETKKLNPSLECCYLFDNACFPYGNKSESFLISRVSVLLAAACTSLQPDLIVIACNTASTVALPTVRHQIPLPVVGVVPAIKPAAALSKRRIIGLLATPGTVRRAYTDDLIAAYASDLKVLRLGTVGLVELAEKKLQGLELRQQEVEAELQPWLSLPAAERPDVVVLGCTHFPLIKAQLAKAFGPGVRLIDSGAAVARRVQSLLFPEAENGRSAGLSVHSEHKVQAVQNAFIAEAEVLFPACWLYCTRLDDSIARRAHELAGLNISGIGLLPGVEDLPVPSP